MTTPQPITFRVERACPPRYCHEGTYQCTCWPLPEVDATVDEMTDAEIARYAREGTDAQRNEIRAYQDEERDYETAALAA